MIGTIKRFSTMFIYKNRQLNSGDVLQKYHYKSNEMFIKLL
jgi:hypothetical protein